MTRFVEQSDLGAKLFVEVTDQALPEKLNASTRYIHFKTIAKGGKAIIQSCLDRYLGRQVCYKQLKPEFQSNEVEQVRFLREARISAMLQHPATIPFYDFGRDLSRNLYFTMKLVHGYTLREVMDYRERYDLNQLVNIIIDVANALAYAHAHGVLHRDIKPENILVGPFGEVLVLDWGLAKVWNKSQVLAPDDDTKIRQSVAAVDPSVTGLGGLEGTVTYMSPEQLKRAEDIDGRSDIFSLGTVLYELVSGVTPHRAETVREMQEKVLGEDPPVPSSRLRYPLPKLLDEVVMMCLSKRPQDRPVDALELVRLLQDAV
jgi:serine/threonine-protein kinase